MNKTPKKGDYLDILLRAPQTIFSTKDVALLWREDQQETTSDRLRKYVDAGKLLRIRRGLYAKDAHYDRLELATRIYTPAYVSFETVLARAGILFQYHRTIFVASYLNRTIRVGDQATTYINMKKTVLSNPQGVERQGSAAIASPERAFLDRLYVSRTYHFDTLDPLNWKRVFALVPLYNNKRFTRKVQTYYQSHR